MSTSIMLIPANNETDLTETSLALVKALQTEGINANYFCPIEQTYKKKSVQNQLSIGIKKTEYLLSNGWINELLEEIVALHEEMQQSDITIVQGLAYLPNQLFVSNLNLAIAEALNAKIIILAGANKKDASVLNDQINIAAQTFDKQKSKRVLGYILDKVDVNGDFISSNIHFLANIPQKNRPRLSSKNLISFIAKQFSPQCLLEISQIHDQYKPISPPLFRHRLIEIARKSNKKIILPEGNDIRIIKAAMICTRKKIAHCILLGDIKEISHIANANGIELNQDIEIINPSDIADNYIEPLFELRKIKGLTLEAAKESLADWMVVATMMLQMGEVDGIVSGAQHTTANTIRPALQIIKTVPGMSLVSSVFFMCLPDQVIVYGDCAVNPNPNAKELAEIAIQSADSAKLFGIEPKVAMISYSTGDSGQGIDVEKVREATKIVREKRPDIVIDGPLQYDAATVEEVAKQKAPNSQVAGHASVCIFPDLNTGNALYKAVQRSADILSIGPMLQGLRKPVNDLSRGCLVEDIVFTIALTAIQAS